MIKRGEIYYINKANPEVGSEQWSGGPAIIVSNDNINQRSQTVEVVYLTTQPKADLPTHATISSAPQVSTALCEQVSTVSVDRIGYKCGTCSEYEMRLVEDAIIESLGIDVKAAREEYYAVDADEGTFEELRSKMEVYRELYFDLLDRLTRKETER